MITILSPVSMAFMSKLLPPSPIKRSQAGEYSFSNCTVNFFQSAVPHDIPTWACHEPRPKPLAPPPDFALLEEILQDFED